MSKTKDLLIEIGTEELPPKNLQRLSKAFVEKITSGLSQAKLSHGEVQRFATPRRLALLVHKLACQQPDHTIEKLGPSISSAYDDNNKDVYVTKMRGQYTYDLGIEPGDRISGTVTLSPKKFTF